MKNDRLIYDIAGGIRAAGKNKIHRQRAIDVFTVLLRFFEDNRLLKDIQPFDEHGKLKQDLIINADSLTDDGVEMVARQADVKWENYLNRSKDENKLQNTSILTRELAKIKDERAKNS